MSETVDRIVLEESWKSALHSEFDASYMRKLREFLVSESQSGKIIYPKGSQIFHALDLCPLHELKVVIIGQDPYHGPSQAHGLSFSVPAGVSPPPSLVNIFDEINRDMGDSAVSGGCKDATIPRGHGCLIPWAQQGVLLLNAVLTVVRGRARSHQGRGWEKFSDKVVQVINQQCENIVFLLWGADARRKGAIVDRNKHAVFEAAHPSPLSANAGFFGCRHFSKANQYLVDHGKDPVDWFKTQ